MKNKILAYLPDSLILGGTGFAIHGIWTISQAAGEISLGLVTLVVGLALATKD